MNRIGQVLSASTLFIAGFGGETLAAGATEGPETGDAVVQSLVTKRFTVTTLTGADAVGALDPRAAEARRLQASILANPRLTAQITAQNVDVTRIVAATGDTEGGLVLFAV